VGAVEPHARDDGSLVLSGRLVVPAGEVGLRATTSGGPGGQHANRSLTKVVATFRVDDSTALSDAQRERLRAALGPVVRSVASRHRSQSLNRAAALDQLAVRLADALRVAPARRATAPGARARQRRLDDKRQRARLKAKRARRDDD
jgi:ribosome-associated protein